MKPLDEMTSADKAGLLHQLFPKEIKSLLRYTLNTIETIKERQWQDDSWMTEREQSIIQQTREKIMQHWRRLHKDHELFADELFGSATAGYMIYTLQLYTGTRQHTNSKFSLAIDLLFNN